MKNYFYLKFIYSYFLKDKNILQSARCIRNAMEKSYFTYFQHFCLHFSRKNRNKGYKIRFYSLSVCIEIWKMWPSCGIWQTSLFLSRKCIYLFFALLKNPPYLVKLLFEFNSLYKSRVFMIIFIVPTISLKLTHA